VFTSQVYQTASEHTTLWELEQPLCAHNKIRQNTSVHTTGRPFKIKCICGRSMGNPNVRTAHLPMLVCTKLFTHWNCCGPTVDPYQDAAEHMFSCGELHGWPHVEMCPAPSIVIGRVPNVDSYEPVCAWQCLSIFHGSTYMVMAIVSGVFRLGIRADFLVGTLGNCDAFRGVL